MAIVRWDPLTDVGLLRTDVNRFFERLGEGGFPARWTPAMDVQERNNEYLIRVDLPGMTTDDVDIEVQDNVLRICGERSEERDEKQEGYYRTERVYGSFERSLTLPEGVEADAIKADFENGVLTLAVPKPEQTQPRKIKIGSGKTIEG